MIGRSPWFYDEPTVPAVLLNSGLTGLSVLSLAHACRCPKFACSLFERHDVHRVPAKALPLQDLCARLFSS
jgi:hypothetical protein